MRKIFFSVLVLVLCGVGIYVYFGRGVDTGVIHNPQVLSAESREIPPLEALIVQTDESSGNRRVISCSIRGCDIKDPPASVDSEALSDGQVWYRYRDRQEGTREIRVLEKVDVTGKITTITEENPLVRPRGMILSTDGTRIAYFLDNIHDQLGLTELWVYDSSTGSTQVVAENLHKADIASRVRWNASSQALWFLTEKDTKELVLVPLSGSAALPSVTHLVWGQKAEVADQGTMDVNDDASLIAFGSETFPGFSQLVVTSGGPSSMPVKKTIKGNIVFIRWMQHGALFYAVQHGENLTFWMANALKEWPIARMKAVFRSAHSTGSADLAAFIADPREEETHLYVLQVASGLIKDQMVLPHLSGAASYLVQANEAATMRGQAVAGITNQLSDATITAFIQAHIGEIISNQKAIAVRIVTTDNANTVYVDYRKGESDQAQRILVTVQDAIYPSWKVLATYTPSGGQWVRSGISHGGEPTSSKVYEWEEGVSQWILKKVY